MQLSPRHSPTSYHFLTRFVVLQEILYEPFFVLIKLLQKIMHFQSKTNFLIQLILLVRFDFAILCICLSEGPFLQFCHHETTNIFIFAYIHSYLFDLSSNQLVQKKN